MIGDPIKLDLKGRKIWFTSDYHLYHDNVIRFDDRPFSNASEMNDVIRHNHNSVVAKDDLVINLGDAVHRYSGSYVPLKEYLSSFNGEIWYVRGNHEQNLGQIAEVWKLIGNLVDLYISDIDRHILAVLRPPFPPTSVQYPTTLLSAAPCRRPAIRQSP